MTAPLPTSRAQALAELTANRFAVVALSKSRAARAIAAHMLICNASSHVTTDIDGTLFHAATFEDTPADLAILRDLVAMVGDLRTAIVWARGRYWPPGQHTRLCQWVACYGRMRAMEMPATLCHYTTDRLYRLEQGEAPTMAECFAGHARPEQAVSEDPRLRETYRLPCAIMGSFADRTLHRDGGSVLDQLAHRAESEGFACCPRYDRRVLSRVR